MTSPGKLSLGEKLAYGCGDFANNLLYAPLVTFLLIFYTDVYGLSAAAVGLMLGLSRALDAVVDPLVGLAADRTNTRWGKFRPYLLWGCGPFAVIGVLLFTTPHFGPAGKLVWAYLTYNGAMIVFSLIAIPYSALLGVVSGNPSERTKAAAWRFVFAYGGVLAIQGGLLFLVRALGGHRAARGWQLSFVVIGLVAIGFFLITFFGTRERVAAPRAQKTPIARDLADLAANGPWLVLLAVTLTWVVFAGARSAVTAHYVKYYVGSRSVTWPWASGPRSYGYLQIVSAFTSIGTVGSIVGTLLVGWFAARVGKKTAFILMLGASVVATASYYWLKSDQLAAMFGLQAFGSVTGGPLCVILWSMYADTADYSEWKNGRRATGLVFAASTMTNKFGWAISGAVVGLALAASGYVANAEQSPRLLHGLVLLMSLVPAALGALSLLLMFFYPLNEKRLASIGSDLKLRRGGGLAEDGREGPWFADETSLGPAAG